MLPVQITVRDVPGSKAIDNLIHKRVEKLHHFYQRITSCRIVIDVPQKHRHQGKLYSAHVDLTIPGKELVINRKQNEDLYIAVRDAFDAAERLLEDYVKRRRSSKKHAINKRELSHLDLPQDDIMGEPITQY